MENKLSFEESIKRLSKITEILEKNETSLDEAVELYKEGIELSAKCKEKLDSARIQISVLEDNNTERES